MVLAAKPLVVSTNVTSKTPLKIQFWLLGAVLGSKFAKITDRENATLNMFHYIIDFKFPALFIFMTSHAGPQKGVEK